MDLVHRLFLPCRIRRILSLRCCIVVVSVHIARPMIRNIRFPRPFLLLFLLPSTHVSSVRLSLCATACPFGGALEARGLNAVQIKQLRVEATHCGARHLDQPSGQRQHHSAHAIDTCGRLLRRHHVHCIATRARASTHETREALAPGKHELALERAPEPMPTQPLRRRQVP